MIRALLVRYAILLVIAIFSIFIIYKYTIKNQNNATPITQKIEQLTSKKDESNHQDIKFENIQFPKNFFFGTAYSDFQTAGFSPASDWANEWDKYSETLEKDSIAKKRVIQKPIHPGIANDFFNRYPEDFDLASQIGVQIHRISLEWARIEPEENKWDLDSVEKYKKIFLYMKKRGIEPMICLNHFPAPKWFADKGGWENNKAPYYYARYAEFLAKKIGIPLKIKWWLTFNEPQFTILVPYGNGTWPPFKGIDSFQDKAGFARIMHVASNVMDGHRLAYRVVHKVMDKKLSKEKIMVSFASAPGAFYPYDENSSLDKLADNAFNVIYSLAVDSFIGNVDRDFIGLNYYGRTRLKLYVSIGNYIFSWLTEEKPFAIQWFRPETLSQGKRPNEFYPKGLYDLIIKFKDYGLPIVITENGLNDPTDNFREEFLVIHLKAVLDAMKDGANVIGYQYWSLTDTWEPGDATFSNFGLIAIDRKNNLARSLRPSAQTYAEIIKTHGISKELLKKHKELISGK